MTRLEAGAFAAKRELVDVADAVEGALGRLSRERAAGPSGATCQATCRRSWRTPCF